MTAADIRESKRRALPSELARLRFDAHLSIRECMAACGASSTSVWMYWEHGGRPADPWRRQRIAEFFETTEDRVWPASTGRIAA